MKDGWRLDYHARKVEIILPNSCFQFSAQASMFEMLELHREGARNHHKELVSVWFCLQAVAAAAAGWAGERWKWRWFVRGRPDHTLTGQSQLNVECYPGNFPNGIELNVFAATVQLNSYCSRTTRASESELEKCWFFLIHIFRCRASQWRKQGRITAKAWRNPSSIPPFSKDQSRQRFCPPPLLPLHRSTPQTITLLPVVPVTCTGKKSMSAWLCLFSRSSTGCIVLSHACFSSAFPCTEERVLCCSRTSHNAKC